MTGRVPLGYRAEGTGNQTVLLLHGLNSHSGTWRKTFPALLPGRSVVAPSLPAQASRVSEALVEAYSELVLELSRHLGLRRATVVGSSMGGWIGMRLASLDQGLVSRLVLEDTAGAASSEARALESSGIPVLIVWGEDDGVLPVDKAYELHTRLARSELRLIPGAKHVPHWEAPDEFNRILVDFLGR